jgi:hypothetical protein
MQFSQEVKSSDNNVKLILKLLLPSYMYQEHIWKDWLSGEKKHAFITEPFISAEVYVHGKYQGIILKKDFTDHIKIDISNELHTLLNKAKVHLENSRTNDEYNIMMNNRNKVHLR